jgi:diacylglycerol kinase (ATP)
MKGNIPASQPSSSSLDAAALLPHNREAQTSRTSSSTSASQATDEQAEASNLEWHRPPAWRVAENLLQSFQYAGQGVWYSFQTQRNFRIHLCVAAVALSLSVWLNLPAVQVALVCITCGLVMVLELFNTALEAVVDLAVGETYHSLAKIAKDCSAGAVLVSAVVSVLVAICLLFPPLWYRLAVGI